MTGPQCRADGCLFLTEENDAGEWECWIHGVQTYPTYETDNDPPETEQATFGGEP